MRSLIRLLLLATAPTLLACPPIDDAVTDDDDDDAPANDTYAFNSRFDGESSVSYSGQTMRQSLILGQKAWLGSLTERIDTGWFPATGDVTAGLMSFYEFDSDTSGDLDHGIVADPLQARWIDISSGKDLRGKVAGNDATGHHLDYSAGFVGWDHADVASPDDLFLHWFAEIDRLAVDRANGATPLDPTGAAIQHAFLSPEGVDYQQIVQKFLGGAIAFSQGTDDYLDDDVDDKGLNQDHTAAEEGSNHSALEHAWDEAFGYFGATRDYGHYTADEIAGKGGRADWQGMHDSDGDGFIDLKSELLFGHALNAGKRDLGAVSGPQFVDAAWTSFLEGRRILASADGELTADEFAALQGHRDVAVSAWEGAIAATVVHYINDVLQDMATFGTPDYSFSDHSKHWSELKGFALGLQFNPRSPLLSDFAALHQLLGQAPVLPGAGNSEVGDYTLDLLEARDLLGDAYDFDASDLGDDAGLDGW